MPMFGPLIAMLAPVLLMLVGAIRADAEAHRFVLFMGTGALIVLAVAIMIYHKTLSPPTDLTALLMSLMALGWLMVLMPDEALAANDWYRLLLEGTFALIAVAVLTHHWLLRSGAWLFRRARILSHRIANKLDWPNDLQAIKDMPLIQQFREALIFDAVPALELLANLRPEVRYAALCALEYRPHWRPGQVDTILNHYPNESVPLVRVAAIQAVASVDDRRATEVLSEALHDSDPRVRQAAGDALFWDSERRWDWLRNGVRNALADPKLHDCGPLIKEGQKLPLEAVANLTAWSAERGIVSIRAAQTLSVHFIRTLQENPDEVKPELMKTLQDPQAPPMLRIHFARLLSKQRMIDPSLLEKLLDASNPAPLRQMASELLLQSGWNTPAVSCLREIAKLPNRELALDTARIIQTCLNVDMGLAVGQAPPPPNSAKAAEIVRRLTLWAQKTEGNDNALDTGYKPAPQA